MGLVDICGRYVVTSQNVAKQHSPVLLFDKWKYSSQSFFHNKRKQKIGFISQKAHHLKQRQIKQKDARYEELFTNRRKPLQAPSAYIHGSHICSLTYLWVSNPLSVALTNHLSLFAMFCKRKIFLPFILAWEGGSENLNVQLLEEAIVWTWTGYSLLFLPTPMDTVGACIF